MNSKDYEVIAGALSNVYEAVITLYIDPATGKPNPTPDEYQEWLCNEFVRVLQKDNPKFNAKLFLAAVYKGATK